MTKEAELLGLEQCEAEPIHIPGSIQPHGVLLALDQADLLVLQASSSAQPLLGIPADRLLGRDLAVALDPALAKAVRDALQRCRARPDVAASFDWCPPRSNEVFTAHVHLSDRTVVLELEASAAAGRGLSEVIAAAMGDFDIIRQEMDLSTKLEDATRVIRRLTGYDRVMVYRFDEDWHGEVIAEARRPNLEPYLGLHYPGSDIPSQARQIFLVNPFRVIFDVDHVPSILWRSTERNNGEPLDLSRSVLRSVSPVHLEYLRNMRVRSTLTLSLIRDGRLWGLVACHHQEPHALCVKLREIVGWMVRDLATQIALTEEVAARDYAIHLKHCRDRIISLMRQGERLPALLSGPEITTVLGAIGADGVAFIRGQDVVTGGATPNPRHILDIAAGLSMLHGNGPSELFVTDCLSEHLPRMAMLAGSAAGVALFPLDAAQSIKLMWFRGEQLREVNWGGDPDKAVASKANGELGPRQSFAAWSEIVRLRSRCWRPQELESARRLGTLIDIEWRKMAEETLREKEALLRDVLDSLSAQIAVLDEQGTITTVNAAWRSSVQDDGGNAACLPGEDYPAVFRQVAAAADHAEAKTIVQGLNRVLTGEVGTFSVKYPLSSGLESRWFEMRVFSLRGPRSGAVVVHEDVTAQTQAEETRKRGEEKLREATEEALRLSQESFRLAVDNMPDGLAIYDERMRYRFLNSVSMKRSGISLRACVGRRDDEIYAAEVYAQYLPHLRATYETRAAATFECALDLATGRYDFLVTYVPMLEHEEVYQVFGFYHDITEQKRSEAKLAEQAHRLREADRRKDEFLAMLAHELRNPLAPIANAVQLLKRGGMAADSDWCLAAIERQAAHLTRLVDDLLDVSRISRGIIELQLEPLRLEDIITPALENNRPAIEARRHRLEVELPGNPLSIQGDRVRLTQVVSNLLSNAAKFTEQGGQIWLTVEAGSEGIAIRIRDSGRGIDRAQQASLFDLFFQVDRAIARTEGGLGIGLSLAKRLVEMHGGTIEVHSEGRGTGSEFCVRLPRISSSPSACPHADAGSRDALPATPNGGGLRILVVDDNRDALDSLELLLGGEGYEVFVAFDGGLALRLATTMQPDVVLLDIGLPGMDGYAVASTLRQRSQNAALRIVAITGYGQPESLERSKSAGFDLHLVKPLDFEGLLRLLSQYRRLAESS